MAHKGVPRNRSIEVRSEPSSKQAMMIRAGIGEDFIAKYRVTVSEIIE